MEIYERPDSAFYWYSFTVNGHRVRGSTKRPLSDPDAARRVLADEYTKALNAAQFGEKPEICFEDAVEKVIASVDKTSTQASYRLSGHKFIGKKVTTPGMWHVDPGDPLHLLNDFLFEDFVSARKREGLANNSINIEIRFLKRMHNLLRKKYRVDHDVSFPQLKKFEKERYFEPHEVSEIIAELEKRRGSPAYDKAKDLFVFLLNTGMRLSEALSLEWPDVNLRAYEIHNFNIKTGVTSIVPVSDKVAEILRRRDNQRQPFEGMSRAIKVLRETIHRVCNENDRVVLTKGGRATIHTCRDTYATNLRQKGLELVDIKDLLGHRNIATTQKYARADKRQTAQKARNLL